MHNQNVEEIKRLLGLKKHPLEGGFFKETYRASSTLPASMIAPRFSGDRSLATAIYFLLTPETYSEMHRITADEIYHFYAGNRVEILQLFSDGSGRIDILGPNILEGEVPQLVVKAGVWQGSRLVDNSGFALLGTTVSPGFEMDDYESGDRETLAGTYPQFEELITALT